MLIVVLFGFLNIKSVKIYAIPFIFATTLLLYKLDTLLILKQNNFVRIGYNGFLFPHSYSGDGLGATHLGLHLSTHAEKKIDLHLSTHAEKEIRYIQYGPLLLFQ